VVYDSGVLAQAMMNLIFFLFGFFLQNFSQKFFDGLIFVEV
jgi:hypothetical protein